MKPTSDRKRQANRRNAQRSTGPRTPEGKARSRANAIKHGLLAETVLINGRDPIENPDDLNDLLNALIDQFSPRDPHQQLLVERLAICYWRLRRAYRHEAQSIMQRRADDRSERARTSRDSEGQPEPFLAALPPDAEFSKLIRYESLIDRELQRTLQQLHRAQRPEPFTPITPPPPDGTPASAGPHGGLADLLGAVANLHDETKPRPDAANANACPQASLRASVPSCLRACPDETNPRGGTEGLEETGAPPAPSFERGAPCGCPILRAAKGGGRTVPRHTLKWRNEPTPGRRECQGVPTGRPSCLRVFVPSSYPTLTQPRLRRSLLDSIETAAAGPAKWFRGSFPAFGQR